LWRSARGWRIGASAVGGLAIAAIGARLRMAVNVVSTPFCADWSAVKKNELVHFYRTAYFSSKRELTRFFIRQKES
jgi:hypothetical protein